MQLNYKVCALCIYRVATDQDLRENKGWTGPERAVKVRSMHSRRVVQCSVQAQKVNELVKDLTWARVLQMRACAVGQGLVQHERSRTGRKTKTNLVHTPRLVTRQDQTGHQRLDLSDPSAPKF